MYLHGRCHQNDEGTRRTADLEPAAAESRDQETTDNSCVEALRGCGAGGDGNGHGEGQGNDGNCQPCDSVRAQVRQAVAFAQYCHQLRGKGLDKSRPFVDGRRNGVLAHMMDPVAAGWLKPVDSGWYAPG